MSVKNKSKEEVTFKIPKIVDGDKYLKYAKFLNTLDDVGFQEVEISDENCLKNLEIPVFLRELSVEIDISLPRMINTIIRDFVIRMKEGNCAYEKGILKRIDSLPKSTRDEILKLIFKE
jgi:hypothetical protein